MNLLRGRNFAVLAVHVLILAITTGLLLITFLFSLATVVARLQAHQPFALYAIIIT